MSRLIQRIHDSLMADPDHGADFQRYMAEMDRRLAAPPVVMNLPKPPGSSYIPFGVGRIELPPEVGYMLGVVAQVDNIVVVDCTHGVATITFPNAFDWQTEPQVKIDLLFAGNL